MIGAYVFSPNKNITVNAYSGIVDSWSSNWDGGATVSVIEYD